MKLNDRLKVPQERIDEIFEKLAKLPKPKAPLLKDVFESKRKQIEMAVGQGHSLRTIAAFLSRSGINVSHVTLRKVVNEWHLVADQGMETESNINKKVLSKSSDGREAGCNSVENVGHDKKKNKIIEEMTLVKNKGNFIPAADRAE